MNQYVNKTSRDYHLRQLKSPYESTKALLDFCRQNIDISKISSILDLACGTGVNSFYLADNDFESKKFFGYDLSEDAINIGNNYKNNNKCSNVDLSVEDLYKILEGDNNYDMTMFVQTLFAMEDAYECLEGIMKITNRYVVLLSLFTEDSLEVMTKVKSVEQGDTEYIFNIIPISKLEIFANQRGYKLASYQPFEINIELSRKGNGLGSYTKKKENGKLDTFTGPIYLPWGFVLLERN